MQPSWCAPALILIVGLSAPLTAAPRTTEAFESSDFCKKLGHFEKKSWTLKTGGTNASYTFVDPDSGNSEPSLGVELLVVANQVKDISIGWSPYDSPVKWTSGKSEQVKNLLKFWGAPNMSEELVVYAKAHFRDNYPNGVGNAAHKPVGSLSVQCGRTGNDVYLAWK